MGEELIELANIEKSFGYKKILKGINLSVDEGDVVALIGPSETGKTTLLRTINFLEKADKGTIQIADQVLDVNQAKESEIIDLRRKTAMVFQNYSLFKNKTLLENVMEGLVIVQGIDKSEAESIAKAEIERVGLGHKLDAYPKEISGGQQQRIGIARALALKPQVLLLDEPTSSLDPETSVEVLKILKEVAKSGITMIIATHEMAFAENVSNRVVFMEDGYIIEDGSPDQIFNHAHEQRTIDFVQEISRDIFEEGE